MNLLVAGAALLLSACASVNFDDSVKTVNQEQQAFTQGHLSLWRTAPERDAKAEKSAQLLAKPLDQTGAVQLALVNSAALQAMLAKNWADAARAAQSGRIPNPVLALERSSMHDELEIGRSLSFGLLDLLTLPLRYEGALSDLERARLQLATDVVDQVTSVRQAWVKAVGAEQTHRYAKQVLDAAQASAELARRMQKVGNFSKLDRARQQAFYADAATQLALAQFEVTATREGLIRALGLTEKQAQALTLAPRLPDLPRAPLNPDDVSQQARSARLDVQLATVDLNATARRQGLEFSASLTDVEWGIRRDTVFDNAGGTATARHGYEISLKLPLFDGGGMRRDAMTAQMLAAVNTLESTMRNAGSELREAYAAYRTTYDIAAHYRDEIVPLRKTIAEENVLRYNGMFIGVFDLLADTREQIGSVQAAIAATRQFWLADAALQAALAGRPLSIAVSAPAAASSIKASAGH